MLKADRQLNVIFTVP